MSKRSSTPLYELIMSGRRPGSIRTPSGVDPVIVEETDEVIVHEEAPATARVVRVPMGFLLLGVAALVVALVLAYMWGSFQGNKAAKTQFEEAWLAGGGLGESSRGVDDPLSTPAPLPSDTRELEPPPPSVPPAGEPPAAPEAGPSGDAGWGEIESDPRRDGEHYLVLAETRPEGAIRLAAFAREHGLETYVISSHNPRFRRVIAYPGVSQRSESSPEVRRLRAAVLEVGAAWKAKYPGESDLSDAYLIP